MFFFLSQVETFVVLHIADTLGRFHFIPRFDADTVSHFLPFRLHGAEECSRGIILFAPIRPPNNQFSPPKTAGAYTSCHFNILIPSRHGSFPDMNRCPGSANTHCILSQGKRRWRGAITIRNRIGSATGSRRCKRCTHPIL